MSQEKRKCGKELLLEGCALIDISGRTKTLLSRSVLGLASLNKISFSVMMLSKDKKTIYEKLKIKHDKNKISAIMHSVKIYENIYG